MDNAEPIGIGMLVRDAEGETLGKISALGEAGFQVDDGHRIYALDEVERIVDRIVFLKPEQELEISPAEFEKARMGHDAFVAEHPPLEAASDFEGGLHLEPDELTDARMRGLHGGERVRKDPEHE